MYETTKLSANQIKCPYCRTITNKLIPYIAYPSVKITKNVNSYITYSYNNNPDYFLHAPKCSHDNTKIRVKNMEYTMKPKMLYYAPNIIRRM